MAPITLHPHSPKSNSLVSHIALFIRMMKESFFFLLGFEPEPYIYYALSISTEVSSRERMITESNTSWNNILKKKKFKFNFDLKNS